MNLLVVALAFASISAAAQAAGERVLVVCNFSITGRESREHFEFQPLQP
jgi:hypothetical protein